MKKIKVPLLILILILSYFIAEQTLAESWQDYSYQVTYVVDGDTFEATDGNLKFRVRVAGMDTPESKQKYGKQATYQFRKLIEDKKVKIKPVGRGRDKYNRILGQVYLEDQDVSISMIENGHATYYRPKCLDYSFTKQKYDYDPRPYVEAEKLARRNKTGIWSFDKPMLPCDYRRNKKK